MCRCHPVRSPPSGGSPSGFADEVACIWGVADLLRADSKAHEIHPCAPDAWIDHTKTKPGYETPSPRHFYEYVPPRPVAEIDADLAREERLIQELLGGLHR